MKKTITYDLDGMNNLERGRLYNHIGDNGYSQSNQFFVDPNGRKVGTIESEDNPKFKTQGGNRKTVVRIVTQNLGLVKIIDSFELEE